MSIEEILRNLNLAFQVERWNGPAHVFVRFEGHTDDAPVRCFEFHDRERSNFRKQFSNVVLSSPDEDHGGAASHSSIGYHVERLA